MNRIQLLHGIKYTQFIKFCFLKILKFELGMNYFGTYAICQENQMLK